MAETLKGKNVVVVGADGQVGRPLVKCLLEEGARVVALCKTPRYPGLEEWLCKELAISTLHGRLSRVVCDVCHYDPPELLNEILFCLSLLGQCSIHGLVYSVNHYPVGGVTEAVRLPLSERSTDELKAELAMHAMGLQNTLLAVLSLLAPGAAGVIISSAITEIPDEQCPPFLHAAMYTAAKAAQDVLVKGWRRDPQIRKNGIRLHLLKPSAIDTPSHDGPLGAPKDKRIPMPVFLDEVLAALNSTEIITKVIRA